MIDAPTPGPGPGQVRVAVRAAGVQPADAMLRSGRLSQWSPAYRDIDTRHVRGKVVPQP